MSIEQNIKSLIIEIIDKIDCKPLLKLPCPIIVNKEKVEEETYEYDGLTYMQRKIKKLQKSTLNSFGTSLSGMKKSYLRIERERLELKRKQEEKEEESRGKDNDNVTENYVVFKKDDKGMDIVSVPQMIKRDNDENDSLYLNKKKVRPAEVINVHGYTPVKKKKVSNQIEEYEDFGLMMSKAVKAKPKIQLNKESFIEELKKKKEEELNQHKINNSVNSDSKQVIKLE